MNRLYREVYQQTIDSSFEPDKQNKFQTWLTEKFIPDQNPFYIQVSGKKLEIAREKVAATWLTLGKSYMEAHNTHQLPQGFLKQVVLKHLQDVAEGRIPVC